MPDTKEHIVYDSMCMRLLEAANSQTESINRIEFSRCRGKGRTGKLSGYTVSVWGDDRILEMDSGDGYTTQ